MSWPHQTLVTPRASSPSIVFLHGFLGHGSDWLPVAGRLAGHFLCVLPDLPGHGTHTNLDPIPPLSFPGLAEGLAGTIETLGLQKPILVGYSLGARLALHFACERPDLVGGLVLESVSPGLVGPLERAERAALDDARAARLLASGLQAFIDEWYRAGLWASLRRRPGLLAQAAASRAGGSAAWMAKVVSELSPGRMPPLWDCLPGLAMPVLVLAGELDAKYAGLAGRIAGQIPGAAALVVPEAGHNIHLEQPERFVEAVLGFLSRLPAWRAHIPE